MEHFAVAGRPVLHSRSPQIFNAAFRALGKSGRYIRMAPESAAGALDLFRRLGLAGLNVTTPFKTDIMAGLKSWDEAAGAIGAVNVVLRHEDGLFGANTDHLGVSGALAVRGIAVRGRRCLVAGAGGAGRAAAFALARGGGEVVVLDIDPGKSARAARDFGITAAPSPDWPARFEGSDVIVAAVPGGGLSLKGCRIRPEQILLEADYRRPVLRDEAAARGLRYIPGREWLKHQAVPALGLFLGLNEPAADIDWEACLESPSPAGRDVVALTGFMGSGKTAVGRELAARLGYDFADTDEWIEKAEGRSVAELFETRGEPFFRIREKEALARLTQGRRLVLSCGGGVVLDADNRSVLAASALTIWIYASLETTFGRIRAEDRPLLRGASPRERAAELFAARRDDYFLSADLVVDNEGSPARTVERIHEEIRSSL